MLTLGTQRDLTNDMLIKGIIDSVVTVNQFYHMLPFHGIQGNALAYNREEVGVDQMDLVSVLNTGGGTINADAQKFTRESTELTTIIGDAQVNGLIQAVGSDFVDATAVQVAAKAKGIGRKYMNMLINGTEQAVGYTTSTKWTDVNDIVKIALSAVDFAKVDTLTERKASATVVVNGVAITGTFTSGATEAAEVLTASGITLLEAVSKVSNGLIGFTGLDNLAASGNTFSDSAITVTTQATANELLARLDKYVDRVKDKDGMVDYIMMNSGGVRKYTAALRFAGTGLDTMDVKMSSGGVMKVQSYRGIPIFRNDFIDASSLAGLGGGDNDAATKIFVGTVDDGSMTHGIAGLTAKNSSGMQVQKLGARELVDADITRVKWYCGLAHFSELGLVKGVL